nr:hypothetical protein [Tanacetum cinerariifolium]
MDQDSAHMVAVSKVPMLKPSEFEIWRMRIEQYIQMMDYALWEVIENGVTLPRTQVVDGVTTVLPIITAEEKAQRRLEAKARSTLMIEDVNQKLLRSLSPEWNTHVAVWRNKADLDTMSMNDLYNNLKASQPNSPQLAHEDVEQIHPNDIEEMDLRWKMAMLTMRAKRFLKKTKRKLTINGNVTLGFDMQKVECYNCYKRGHFARVCRALRNQNFKHKESTRRTMLVETPASTDLVSCDGLDGYDLRNFKPPKPDLSFTGLDEFVKPEAKNSHDKSSEEKTKVVRKNVDAPIIEEWVSDDEEENVAQPRLSRKQLKLVFLR